MKKVRFESPLKPLGFIHMEDIPDCHSPRPICDNKQITNPPNVESVGHVEFSFDPVSRFESTNSSPYPKVHETNIPFNNNSHGIASKELELSMLDDRSFPRNMNRHNSDIKVSEHYRSTICSTEKINHLDVNDNSFFIKRGGTLPTVLPKKSQCFPSKEYNCENNPKIKKAELINVVDKNSFKSKLDHCQCHFCLNKVENSFPHYFNQNHLNFLSHFPHHFQNNVSGPHIPYQNNHPIQSNSRCTSCKCSDQVIESVEHPENTHQPLDSVQIKSRNIEKIEKQMNPKLDNQEIPSTAIEKKEKREPTVADLFKIIKLQNEQLQLLQEKVDKFISCNKQSAPMITESNEKSTDHCKMSIGVMTSFEMVRTSTVINQEYVKQTIDNAQVHCNKSQISITETLTRPSVNINFLDGITPSDKSLEHKSGRSSQNSPETVKSVKQNNDILAVEKTVNEHSLCNVQVENAITPQISPEQTMYLDIRDYSDSQPSSYENSNVGWTYYNKVMTHVNHVLNDSEIPSSASNLYRNIRQQCMQMHIDKTNVSVAKRVTFGERPMDTQRLQASKQGYNITPSTDTSLKMNQLAAKYLKNQAPKKVQSYTPVLQTKTPVEMSFATKNYMERHNLLQGLPMPIGSSTQTEIPRFLDITALKKQPKLL